MAEPEASLTLADPIIWGGPIIALIFIIVVLVQLRAGLNKLLKTRELEEQEFQRSAETMAEIGSGGAPALIRQEHQDPAPDPAGEKLPSSSGQGVEGVVRQMMGLGLLAEKQGVLPLAIEPPGVIYRLKSGGSCAILPRLECEEVMRFCCRRFDMVVVAGGDGDALVVERFQERVPSMLTLPRAGG